MSLVIAVDVMGGDHAPHAQLTGLQQVLSKNNDVHFRIFGDESIIRPMIKDQPKTASRLEILHAPECVTNTTSAREALRGLRKSSIRMAIEDVAEGRSAGVISAGNTGAYMSLAKIILKTLPGIDRPAIASSMPTQKGGCILLDLGANVEASALNLLQFAIMGEAFARTILNRPQPSVGLLNVGAEELKGHAVVKQAQELIRAQNILSNFYGFVEGDDIFSGTTDVVVTDGFSGNIALKSAEGCARFFSNVIKDKLTQNLLSKIGALLAKTALNEIKQRLDPRSYNGAPFLGLQGIAVKSHGGADEVGFQRALEITIDLVRNNVNSKISEGLAKINLSNSVPVQSLHA